VIGMSDVMMQRVFAGIVLAVVSGCRAEPPPATPDATAPPPAQTAPTAIASASSSASVEAGAPALLPDLARRTKLTLRQGQGGPSAMRCKGTVYEIEIDLVTNAWKYGTCAATGANAADAPLVMRTGKMRTEDRAKLDAVYKTIERVAAPRCPNDAGVQVLILEGGDGGAERFACGEPFGFTNGGVFAVKVMQIVNTPAPP
jgi:hypothetical protein